MRLPIWKWYDDDYRAHVNADLYHQMIRWVGVTHGSTYTYPNEPKEYDVQFGSDLLPQVTKTLKEALKSTDPAKGHNDLRRTESPTSTGNKV